MIVRVQFSAVTRSAGRRVEVYLPGEVMLCDGCLTAAFGAAGGEGCTVEAAESDGWEVFGGERCPACAHKETP